MVSKINTSPKSGLTFLPLILLLCFSITNFSSKIFGQAANLDQIRNGSATSPITPASWVNGNAGPSNAHFAEGYSIPYRMRISGLVGNSNTEHTLIIQWDTKDQNGHAIDYITHYQNLDNPVGSHLATFGHTAEVIDPTIGTAFSGAPTLFQIPLPTLFATSEVSDQPRKSFTDLPGLTGNNDITKMAIWGGTITSITYGPETAPDATTASTKTACTIKFKSANGSTALIAWAGHIAAEYDWGVGRGATGVSGSPYHTRLVSIDGSGGNQDRSLKADAVIIPPPLCGISDAQFVCVETPFLTFTAAGSSTGLGISYVWTLTNGSPSAGAKIDPVTGNTSFSVKVVPTNGTSFTGGTFNLSLTVNKVGATSTTCGKTPAGTIIDVQVDAQDEDNTLQIDLNAGTTASLGIQSISPGTTADYTFLWKLVSQPVGANSSISNSNSENATFNVLSPFATGEYVVRVIATQTAAPNCKDSSNVTIVVSGGVTCGINGPTPVCPGSQDNVYFYDPDGDNDADPIPDGFTAQWTFVGDHPSADFDGSTTGNTVKVDVEALGSSCNTSYTVKLTLTAVPPGITVVECTPITVSVEDTEPPVITVCPPDRNLQCGSSTDPEDTGEPEFTDNCFAEASKSDVTVSNCNIKVITRTWTVTDRCGNTASCVQLITLKDTEAPVITCLDNGNITVTDNCSVAADIVTYFKDENGVRHWTAVDAGGNTSTKDCPLPTTLTQERTTNTLSAPVLSSKVQTNVAPKSISAADAGLKVKAFPNPFSDQVYFRFSSTVSGKASLEIYNVLGQKVGIVYEGVVKAGEVYDVKFNVRGSKTTALMYRLNVNDKSASGKLFKE